MKPISTRTIINTYRKPKPFRLSLSGLTIKVLMLFMAVGLNLTAFSQEKTTSNDNTENCESPYFIVLSEGSDTEQLPLKSTDVGVTISGVIAHVEVNQVYTNTGKSPIEAVYVFPASTRAAVHGMVMTIGDREIVAVIDEKEQARQRYETAKSEGKAASLLEEHRANVFQMNVANIMPGATIEVQLTYSELLVPTDNIYSFVYPTVVGPRYVSKGEIESNTSEAWTSNPYMEEGIAPTSTLNIKVDLNAGLPIQSMRCETHKNKVNYSDKKRAQLSLTETNGGNRDFVMEYKLAGKAIETGILTYEDPKGENYFVAMMQPPAQITSDEIPSREYVFVVDVSGSMSGFPLDVSKTLMHDLLSNLKKQDKFNIVFFAGGANVFSPKSLPATEENIKSAIEYMNSRRGGGGTELINALKTAMTLNSDDDCARTFAILTDGYISVEKETFDYIRENLGNANFFSFGIGTSVNRLLIEGMAHVGYGESFIALNKDEAVKQAKKFQKYISTPALTNIKVNYNGFEAYDVLPESVPDLFAQRPLIITGKYKGKAQGTINVTGISGNQKYSQSLTVEPAPTTSNKALKYLWAREKVRLVADYHNLRKDEDTKKEIIDLGMKYNLLTEYTSFIAIDSEISNESKNSTTVNQPLPLPQGVTNQALSSPPSRSYTKAAIQRPGTPQMSLMAEEMEFDMAVVEEEQFDEATFFVIEEMPQFQGKDVAYFQKYIQKKVNYPKEAAESNITGNVYVEFTIDEKGKLIDIRILRSPDDLLSNEVIRVLKESPDWTPGKQSGKTVAVKQTIVIKFNLS